MRITRFGARPVLSALALSAAVGLTGCSNMVTSLDGGSAVGSAISGKVHGGIQPISAATVTIYSAGTTGYGSAGTVFATTLTASDGSFSFNKLASDSAFSSGVHDATSSTYSCPTSGDPEMYIEAKGGFTQGQGQSSAAQTNTAASFIFPLGRCNEDFTTSTYVYLNEVTTAAALAALQQYFNPVTETLGYSGSTQSTTAFQNGFMTFNNLVNTTTGTANASFTPSSSVAGVTITAVPEFAKLNTIADVLAACVNTISNGTAGVSSACSTLFANALPPVASTTSQPNVSFPTASDTLQAAYYMLTNPTNTQNSGGATTKLLALAGTAPPYGAPVAQLADWTIGIGYTPTGTCAGVGAGTTPSFLASAQLVAVDGNGNIWMNSGNSTNNALVEISPTGTPLNCAVGTIAAGRGLTIDVNNNVWTTGTGNNYEFLSSNNNVLSWPVSATATGITADGNGNVFYFVSGAQPQEYVGGASATTTAASTAYGTALASGTYLFGAADTSGNIYTDNTGGNNIYSITSTTSTDLDASAGLAVNAYGIAVDAQGNLFGGSTCCTQTVSNTFFKYSTTSGSGTNSVKFLGGLVAPRATAVDGAGNVWAALGYPVGPAGANAIGSSTPTYGVVEVDNSLTIGLSPNGTTPGTCVSSGTNCYTNGGFQKASLVSLARGIAVDPTGNVWVPSTSGTTSVITEIVGQAVPVVTPLSLAAKNTQLGTKP